MLDSDEASDLFYGNLSESVHGHSEVAEKDTSVCKKKFLSWNALKQKATDARAACSRDALQRQWQQYKFWDKGKNISRILIISFIKLVTITGNLVSTAAQLAEKHGNASNQATLSKLSRVTTYLIIPLLVINTAIFKTIPEYRSRVANSEYRWFHYLSRAVYISSILFCLSCSAIVGMYNFKNRDLVYQDQGLEFLVLPLTALASCILKLFLDPYTYLGVRDVKDEDFDKNYADMVQA